MNVGMEGALVIGGIWVEPSSEIGREHLMTTVTAGEWESGGRVRVKRLLTADRRVVKMPDWLTVSSEVARLRDKLSGQPRTVILEHIDGGMMLIDYDARYGHYVAVQDDEQVGDMVLIDAQADQQFVECRVGERDLALPRYMFVSAHQAQKAVEHFAHFGGRCERSQWRDAFALTGARMSG